MKTIPRQGPAGKRRAAAPVAVAVWLGASSLVLPVASPAPLEDHSPRRLTTAEQVQVGLVLIDVVVRDGSGVPVRGLTREAFDLLVDRLPVGPEAIESFEEVCLAPQEATAEAPVATPNRDPIAAPGFAGPLTPSHIVVVFDFSHLTLGAGRQALHAARAFLDTQGAAGDRIMLLAYSDRLRLLQDFTSSKSLLVDALDGLLLEPATVVEDVLEEGALIQEVARVPCDLENQPLAGYDLMIKRMREGSGERGAPGAGGETSDRPGMEAVQGDVVEHGSSSPRPRTPRGGGASASAVDSGWANITFTGRHSGATCIARREHAAGLAAREELRAGRLLKVLEDLMPALGALQGRKALVLFTDALRDQPGIQYLAMAGETPVSVGINLQPQILSLTREANAAGVALYTAHAGGLQDPAEVQFLRTPGDARDVKAVRHAFAEAARSGLDSALSLQSTLAQETGGRAIQRTNDIGAVLRVAQRDLSCYYLLGYRGPGRGDNARHSLVVRLNPTADGIKPAHEVRHRPYFIDHPSSERRERLLRSALDVPDLHPDVPLSVEAFAMAPAGTRRRVLLKTTIPLESIALLPARDGRRDGRVQVRIEVTQGNDLYCAPESDVPLSLPPSRDGVPPPERLIHETECDLAPGSYDFSVAVLDLTSQVTGARRAQVVVPTASLKRGLLVSDAHLWVRDPAAVLVTSGASGIGLKDQPAGLEAGAFVPRARRQLAIGQSGVLSVLVCPPSDARVDTEHPVRVARVLTGEAGAKVASFRELVLTNPPDLATGCWQLLHQIPAGSLGPGVYTLRLRALGDAIGPSLSREVSLSVQ